MKNNQLIKKFNMTAKDIAVIEDHLHYGYGYEYLEARFSFSELEVILDSKEDSKLVLMCYREGMLKDEYIGEVAIDINSLI